MRAKQETFQFTSVGWMRMRNEEWRGAAWRGVARRGQLQASEQVVSRLSSLPQAAGVTNLHCTAMLGPGSRFQVHKTNTDSTPRRISVRGQGSGGRQRDSCETAAHLRVFRLTHWRLFVLLVPKVELTADIPRISSRD